MNTDTPETDKFFATFADGEYAPSHAEYYVRLQDLERERDEAREELDILKKTPKKKRSVIASSELFCIDIKLGKKDDCDAQIIETLKELLPHFKKRGMGIDDVVWAILHSVEPDGRELWGYLDHFFAAYDWKDSQQNSKAQERDSVS